MDHRSTMVYPSLLSARRLTTLFASLLVALSAGTNYAFSAFGPQLGSRLNISHTKLNVIGLAGNVGVYASGPVWGRIVDAKGPQNLLIAAFILLLTGYSGLRYMYNSGAPSADATISIVAFAIVVMFNFFTGVGGNAGLMSAVNSTAKTFPDKARATATGIVISGFGLSAFAFSATSHVAFPGDTSSFLLLLSLGTSIPMIIGYFLVRPIPLPPEVAHGLEHNERLDIEVSGSERNDDHTTLLDHDELVHGNRHNSLSNTASTSMSRRAALNAGLLPNVYGRKLWRSTDFWLLFSILSILSGTGLMYINNVGAMTQALFRKVSDSNDGVEGAKLQAAQVSAISVMNFAGRIFIGLVSDSSKNRLGLPRSYSMVLVSSFFLISQIAAANIDDIQHLWIASALLGLAHGSVFSLFPLVTLDWFGMPHFSENWGYISVSPLLAGNLFSIAFGRNLDAHERDPNKADSTSLVIKAPQCREGRQCYVDSLYLTIGACFVAVCLSAWASLRDRKKLADARLSLAMRRGEILWEAQAAVE